MLNDLCGIVVSLVFGGRDRCSGDGHCYRQWIGGGCIVSFFELRCLYIRRFTEQQMLLLGKGLSTLEPYGRDRKDHRYRVSAHEDPGISSLTSGFVIISVINVSAEFICSLLLISQLVTRYCLPAGQPRNLSGNSPDPKWS